MAAPEYLDIIKIIDYQNISTEQTSYYNKMSNFGISNIKSDKIDDFCSYNDSFSALCNEISKCMSHIKCLLMDKVLLKQMKHNGSVKYTIARTKQDLLQK